jgi:hypothetical protein
MGLSAREQQALECIEARLAGSAPGLAAMLATFNRLTSDEGMPAAEDLGKVRRRHARRRPGRRPVPPHRWLPAAVLLLVAVVLAVTASLTGAGGTGPCAHSWTLACAGPTPGHPPVRGGEVRQIGAW